MISNGGALYDAGRAPFRFSPSVFFLLLLLLPRQREESLRCAALPPTSYLLPEGTSGDPHAASLLPPVSSTLFCSSALPHEA